MEISFKVIESEVKKIYFNDEPVSKSEFTEEEGKYHSKSFMTSLSERGVQEIGKLILFFDIFVPDVGWFKCECL